MPGNGNSGGKPEKPKDPIRQMKIDMMKAAAERARQLEKDYDDLILHYEQNGYRLEVALAEQEQSRQMAIANRDAGAMSVAGAVKAKLAGLMIERSAHLHAHVNMNLHGDTGELTEQSLEGMRERIGSAKLAKLIRFLKDEGIIRDVPELAGPE